MKKKIVIFESGSHSKVVFSEIVKIKNYNMLGFVDNFCTEGEKIITYKNKYYINLGNINSLIKKNKRQLPLEKN